MAAVLVAQGGAGGARRSVSAVGVRVHASGGSAAPSRATVTSCCRSPSRTSGGGAAPDPPASAAGLRRNDSTAVTTVTTSDPDTPTTLTYSIVGGVDAALFTINTATGVLTFLSAPNFEAPADAGTNNVYDVTVQVSDGALTDTQLAEIVSQLLLGGLAALQPELLPA